MIYQFVLDQRNTHHAHFNLGKPHRANYLHFPLPSKRTFSSPPNAAIFGLPGTFSWPNHQAEASAMHAKLAIQRNPPI